MAYEAKDDIVNFKHNHSRYYDYEERVPFDHEARHKRWIFVFSATVGCPIAIFGGVFTNIFAFVVLVRGRLWLKHEGYVYLAANYCANVGVLLFCTSTFWLLYETGYYYPPTTSNFVCKMWHFLMSIFFASGWLSAALLHSVNLPENEIHRRRSGRTLCESKIVVGVIFGVLFICGIPYLAIFEWHPRGSTCVDSNLSAYPALIVEAILMWFIPFLVLLIFLLSPFFPKREGNNVGFSQRIEERSVSDEQMRVMAVTLSAMTLFSQLVLVFIRLFSGTHMGPVVLIGLTFSLSLGVQPILCFVMLKELREEFLSQLRNIRCCRVLFPSLVRYDEVVQISHIREDPSSTTET